MAERLFKRNPEAPFVASQSSLRVASDCERKFAHQYIWRTAQDVDYKTPGYFLFGGAFHKALELTDGDSSKLSQEMLEGIAMSERIDWEKDVPKLVAMVRAYDHKRPAEKMLARELEIVSENFVLYADAIVEDQAGMWWIVDYKSVGVALDPLIKIKIKTDPQVCLYVAHACHIAEKLGLDLEKFGGFSYREIEKPRERIKKSETREEFTNRMVPNVRITNVTLADLEVEATVAQMIEQLSKARSYFTAPETTLCNRTRCVDKGTPCQFWSKCNGGKTYTEAKAESAEACDKF